MKSDEMIKKLCKFSDETDSMYTIKLRDMVVNLTLEQINKIYFPILHKKECDMTIKFAAYYSIFIFYRRYEHHSLLYSLVDEYSKQFSNFKLNDIVLSQYYKFKFIDKDEEPAIENAIKYAKKATENLIINAGVFQNYADLVVCALEAGKEEEKIYLEDAIRCIDRAMMLLKNYPKHYCTKGRLLSWTGDYEKAKIYIRKAIDLEESDNRDSLIRISQYNNYYIDIKTRESIEKLSVHLSNAQIYMENMNEKTKHNSEKVFERLDTMQTRYLELLAFFSAILALILSVTQILGDFKDFNSAMGLVMIMGGVLIIGFCVLRLLITYNDDKFKWKRCILVFSSAMLLISIGYIAGNFESWRS